jgi:hypothetical protein
MIYQAWEKTNLVAPGILRTNTMLQWIIILLVFIPICAGFFIFGKYAWQEDYSE